MSQKNRRIARLEMKAAKKQYKGGKKQAKARLVASKAAIKQAAKASGVKKPTGPALQMLRADAQAPRKIFEYLKTQGVNPAGMNVGQMATAAAAARANQIIDRIESSQSIPPTPPATPDATYQTPTQSAQENWGIPSDELLELYQEAAEEFELDPEEITPDWLEDMEAEMISDEFSQGFNEDPELSNFIDPATWAAIKTIGEEGYKKVARSRAEKGKKTLGMEYDPKTGRRTSAAAPAPDGSLGGIIDKGIESYKRRTFVDYLPIIILAAILLFLLARITK